MITIPGTPDEPSFRLHANVEAECLVIRMKTIVGESIMATTYMVAVSKIESDREQYQSEIEEIFSQAEAFEPGQRIISSTVEAAEIIEGLSPGIQFQRPGEPGNRLTKHFEEVESQEEASKGEPECWVVWNSQFQYWSTDGWTSSFSPLVQVYSDQEKAVIVADMLKAHGNPSAFAHRIPKP